MNKLEKLFTQSKQQLPALELRRDEPMSGHTTFRVGGPAKLMALPKTEEELVTAVRLAREHGVEPLLIGNGSNVLVDDAGLDAFVIQTCPGLSWCQTDGTRLSAGSGILMAALAAQAARHALTGLEFAHGIPGTLGGGVTMNAGAYDGEMRQVVESVRALDRCGEIITFSAQKCEFSYRHSAFSDGTYLILSATVKLTEGDPAAIRARMAELMARRKEKQPLEYPSAGSTFKRPEGHFAAALIDQCGLKGLSVGGAQVSAKHAGFIINTGTATCKDILDLMDAVRERVYRETGVELEPEVKYLR
jgi:UDP-N-acetylmuramate dehydrogenase